MTISKVKNRGLNLPPIEEVADFFQIPGAHSTTLIMISTMSPTATLGEVLGRQTIICEDYILRQMISNNVGRKLLRSTRFK